MSHTAKRLQIIMKVDQLSLKQLFELGQYIKKLPMLPKMTLVKRVPLFSARFYQLSEMKFVETLSLCDATLELSNGMHNLGLPATHKIIRGSNLSVLNLKPLFAKGVNTLLIGKKRLWIKADFFTQPQPINVLANWQETLRVIALLGNARTPVESTSLEQLAVLGII